VGDRCRSGAVRGARVLMQAQHERERHGGVEGTPVSALSNGTGKTVKLGPPERSPRSRPEAGAVRVRIAVDFPEREGPAKTHAWPWRAMPAPVERDAALLPASRATRIARRVLQEAGERLRVPSPRRRARHEPSLFGASAKR
jgi:hypothetical protein